MRAQADPLHPARNGILGPRAQWNSPSSLAQQIPVLAVVEHARKDAMNTEQLNALRSSLQQFAARTQERLRILRTATQELEKRAIIEQQVIPSVQENPQEQLTRTGLSHTPAHSPAVNASQQAEKTELDPRSTTSDTAQRSAAPNGQATHDRIEAIKKRLAAQIRNS